VEISENLGKIIEFMHINEYDERLTTSKYYVFKSLQQIKENQNSIKHCYVDIESLLSVALLFKLKRFVLVI